MLKFIRFIFTKHFWINLAVFAVLFVIVLWGFFAYLGQKTLHGENIKVPLLIGYHVSEAENILKQEQLNYQVIDSIFVENTLGGMVVEQNPDSGFAVKQDRKIYLTLSAYRTPKIPLPNLKWDQKRNVIAQLTSMGFKIGTIRYIPSLCENCLEHIEIDSVKIEPGERLDIGTKLELVLGGGESDHFIAIPYLIGKSLVGLADTVTNTGLIIGSVILDEEFTLEDSLNAKVYRQIPEPGSGEVFVGSAITLFLTTDDNKMPQIAFDSIPNIDSNAIQ